MIYYHESTSSRYKKLARVSGSKSTYTHMNLKAGTTYYYKVVAYKVNAGGVKIKSKGVVIKAMAEK